MTQDNRECNDMNSAFENLRIASDENDRNYSNELDILKPRILQAIDQICQRKKRPDTDSIYEFITRTCATNINKELTELVIEELIAQNVIFNKKTGILIKLLQIQLLIYKLRHYESLYHVKI